MGQRAIVSLLCGIYHLFILLVIPAGAIRAEGAPPDYEQNIKGIIRKDCGRCHSGLTRNLMDYDSLKTYADTGMLETMVQGPMRRFAGNDAQTIIDWVRQGAPEKSGAKTAAFIPGQGGNRPVCPVPGTGQAAPYHPNAGGQITYGNTIKRVLAKDCLRCHSGRFRNMTTYQNVKLYVDNGLLKTLVLPGGPMHRFAGPDTRRIMAWLNAGAPP